MLLRPEHANSPPSPPSIKSPPPLHSSLPLHRPLRSDPPQTGQHRRPGSPTPNPPPLDLRPNLQLHRRICMSSSSTSSKTSSS
ncbi:hypothetical protein FF1_036917 [Malus domestica]